MSQVLNCNLKFSQGGPCFLALSEHEMHELQCRGNEIHLNGIESEFLTPGHVKKMILEINTDCRCPVLVGCCRNAQAPLAMMRRLGAI